MASSDSCLIHFDEKKGPLTSFSAVSYQIFLDCRRIWLTLERSSIVGTVRTGFLWWRVVVCGGASSLA